MAITIKFLADVADWMRGLGKSEEALSDADKQLEEVMRRTIKLGKEAGLTSDQIARDFTEAFGVPLDRAKRAVDEVIDKNDQLDKSVKDGSGRSGEALTELGGVARDVLAGDFQSAASSAAEAILGIASVAGPAGALAGLVASGVAEMVGSFVASWQEGAEEAKRQYEQFVGAVIDGNGRIQESNILSGVQEYLTDADKMAKAQSIITATGLDTTTVLRALNGDLTDSATVTGALAEKKSALADTLDRARNGEQGLSAEILKGNAELGKANGVWDAHTGVMGKAADAYQVYNDAASRGLVRTAEAAVAAGKATETIDEFGDRIVQLPDGKTIYIDTETGKATEDADAIKDKIFSISDKTVTVTVDTSQVDRALNALQRRALTIPVAFNNTGRALLQ